MMSYFVIAVLRLVVPLLILKKPFWGMVTAIVVDGFDMELIKFLGPVFESSFIINFSIYQSIDKILDVYTLTLALLKILSWPELIAYRTAIILYIIRLLGTIIFIVSQVRIVLFFFPNLFEFFFLFYAFTLQYRPNFKILNYKRLIIILLLLLIPKLGQEYLLHIQKAVPWAHFKYDILGWPRTPAD